MYSARFTEGRDPYEPLSHFKDEVSCLKGGTIVHCNSKLFGFIDDNGVMRVGGRLDHASTLSYIE